MKADEPNIFLYDDYRTYLRDWVEFKGKEGFSLRWFARRAGFRTHHIMQLVVSGKRNLSLVSMHKFIRGLGLADEAAKYFEDLVLMNQVADSSSRTKQCRKAPRPSGSPESISVDSAQYRFFRHWLGPVIYEMTRIDGFQDDPEWIAQCFKPPLGLSEVRAVLEDLHATGFLHRKPDGSLEPRDLRLDTGDGVADQGVYVYHEQSLAKASDALHWIPGEQRHFQVVTAAAAADILPKLRLLAAEFEEKLWKLLDRDSGPRNEVFQVSLQIFPAIGKPIVKRRGIRRKRK